MLYAPIAIENLGAERVRWALADLWSERCDRSGGAAPIRNPGAWLTTKLMAMAKGQGIEIVRHDREPRR